MFIKWKNLYQNNNFQTVDIKQSHRSPLFRDRCRIRAVFVTFSCQENAPGLVLCTYTALMAQLCEEISKYNPVKPTKHQTQRKD
ncbi:hypothetical protein VSO92_09405 [Myroides pelagicus]|nr:hypothetical protein [Myroides pelagicus]